MSRQKIAHANGAIPSKNLRKLMKKASALRRSARPYRAKILKFTYKYRAVHFAQRPFSLLPLPPSPHRTSCPAGDAANQVPVKEMRLPTQRLLELGRRGEAAVVTRHKSLDNCNAPRRFAAFQLARHFSASSTCSYSRAGMSPNSPQWPAVVFARTEGSLTDAAIREFPSENAG